MSCYLFQNFDSTLLYILKTDWFLPNDLLRRMMPSTSTVIFEREGKKKVFRQIEIRTMTNISILNEAGRYINALRLLNLYDHIHNTDIIDIDRGLIIDWIKSMTIPLIIIIKPSVDASLLKGGFVCKLPAINNRRSKDVVLSARMIIEKNIHKRIAEENSSCTMHGLIDWIKTTDKFRNACKDVNHKINSYLKDEAFLKKLSKLEGKQSVDNMVMYSTYNLKLIFAPSKRKEDNNELHNKEAANVKDNCASRDNRDNIHPSSLPVQANKKPRI